MTWLLHANNNRTESQHSSDNEVRFLPVLDEMSGPFVQYVTWSLVNMIYWRSEWWDGQPWKWKSLQSSSGIFPLFCVTYWTRFLLNLLLEFQIINKPAVHLILRFVWIATTDFFLAHFGCASTLVGLIVWIMCVKKKFTRVTSHWFSFVHFDILKRQKKLIEFPTSLFWC